jgi:hypothetical protein
MPSSRAICICAWLNLKRFLASNHGNKLVGIRFIGAFQFVPSSIVLVIVLDLSASFRPATL